ncbi:MAG TPA: hypothetical protein VGO40_01185 [Longimicrobium sp.]|nr:hypothetical protein [Longimicrobium sp.]
MRAVFPAIAALVLLPLAAGLTACSDPFGSAGNFIRLDSLTLASVNGPSPRATALDVAVQNSLSSPELPSQVGRWDLQVRQSGASFFLVPNPGNGSFRGAGLQKTTRTLDNPGNAPLKSSSYTRTEVAAAAGDLFYVQSRQQNPECGSLPKFGLLKVISTVADSGVMHIAVISNQSCNDERLKR